MLKQPFAAARLPSVPSSRPGFSRPSGYEGCYILSVPVVKYFPSTLFDWVLIFLLAILRHEAPQWQYIGLIAWRAVCVQRGACSRPNPRFVIDLQRVHVACSGVRSAYFAATLNWIDLPAATASLASLDGQSDQMHGARMSIETMHVFYATRIARAAALLLLSLRQLKVLLNCRSPGRSS